MNNLLIGELAILLFAIVVGFRLGWELLQQNGRMLLRLEALEKRLLAGEESRRQKEESAEAETGTADRKVDVDQSLPRSFLPGDQDERAERFRNRSLANSKIKRDGLKAGTIAPEFRLSRH